MTMMMMIIDMITVIFLLHYAAHSQKDDNEDRNQNNIPDPVLPLIDTHSHGAIRRSIVHSQLDRVLPDILQLLGVLRSDLNENLRKIVSSFEFKSTNVSLKPKEWTLVAFILIKMITIMDQTFATLLDSTSTKKYVNIMLLSYGTNMDYLEAMIWQLHSDIPHLIQRLMPTTK